MMASGIYGSQLMEAKLFLLDKVSMFIQAVILVSC